MQEHWTIEQYKNYKEKKNKYGNEKVIEDGEEFDSSLEAVRWRELNILQKAKVIKDLHRQVRFELQPSYKKNGKSIQSINYIADFVYYDLNKKKKIVEDTKGYRTEVYNLKKKIFEYKYQEYEIKEIRKEDI